MSLFQDSPGATPALSLADILQIEDTPEILEFACPHTAIPVWPQVRIWLIRQIMSEMLFSSGASMEIPFARDPLRAGVTLVRSVIGNRRLRHSAAVPSPLLVTSEAMGDQLVDGRWFNRLCDPFADIPDRQAVVLSDQHEWEWHAPRYNPNIYLHSPLQTWTSVASRLFTGAEQRRQGRRLAALVATRAKAAIGWEMGEPREALFARYIARKLTMIPIRYRAYRRLLAAVRPKALLNSSGCYGHIATLVAAANDSGIVTAEYQHGAISDGHDAYNFAAATASDPRYGRTLPKFLLTYGRWWNARTNAPVEKRAIGYPARAQKLAALAPRTAEGRHVLVLSDGLELDLYLDLARALREAFAPMGLNVVLRPHPSERTKALRRQDGQGDPVSMDEGADIYDSFSGAYAVVSEVSTGLFEAVGLVDRIIMLDTAKARFAFPVHPFQSAGSIEEIVVMIREDRARPMVPEEDLWQPDWRDAYFSFLKEVEVL
jgi:hypothetical protein